MCKDCAARQSLLREAVFKAKMAEALGHAVKGAAEMVGIKPKTGGEELQKKKQRRPAKTNPGDAG